MPVRGTRKQKEGEAGVEDTFGDINRERDEVWQLPSNSQCPSIWNFIKAMGSRE